MRTFTFFIIRRSAKHLLGTLAIATIFALLVSGSMPQITTAEKQDDLPQATQTVFSNPSPITINDNATATPYPSSIVVSGLGNNIPATPGSVRVTVNNFSHTRPDDVGIVLVGPTGAAISVQDGAGAEPDMNGVTYTISDTGATVLPDLTEWSAGIYKPTTYYPDDVFPAPGPGTAYANPGPAGGGTATFASVFGGTNPNGTWKLYVVDFALNHIGSISGGWSLEIEAPAAAGDLDLTFGTGGKVTTDFGGARDSAAALALQPDGKIIAAGSGVTNGAESGNFALVRYNVNGSLDTTFGSGGKVSTDFGGGLDDANAVALQMDGKIVVAGTTRTFPSSTVDDFGVARYNSDGSLDSSFNGTGKLTLNFDNQNDGANAVAIQPDGKIVVAGHAATGGGSWDLALIRINPNGSFDTTFDNDGKVITNVFDGDVRAILLQPDGKIVAIGNDYTSSRDFLLARYNTNGSLDTSFDLDGLVTTTLSINDFANDGALQVDGKIVAVGRTDNAFGLVRYNSDGSLDTSFDGDGKLTTNFSGQAYADAVAIQPNGKILAAGSASVFQTLDDFALARYNSDGSLDTSFDGDGKLTTAFGNMFDWVSALVLQPDGKIVAAGTKMVSTSDFDFALARYRLESPRVQSDFDGDKTSDIALYRPVDGTWYLLQSSNGAFRAEQFGLSTDRIVPGDYDGDERTDMAVFRPSEGVWYILQSTAGFRSQPFGLSTDIPTPADYDGDGKTDIAVFRDGTWFILQSSNAALRAGQFGSVNDKPVTGDYDGDGKCDLAVFRPANGTWYVLRSSDGAFFAQPFGLSTDKPVPGDYDGDLKTDIAVYRVSTGTWYILQTTTGFRAQPFGLETDTPAPADYDGDGKIDIAVFRPADGTWYLLQSTAGFSAQAFGTAGDIPVPSAYVP